MQHYETKNLQIVAEFICVVHLYEGMGPTFKIDLYTQWDSLKENQILNFFAMEKFFLFELNPIQSLFFLKKYQTSKRQQSNRKKKNNKIQ